jgi:hypothetical protein
MVDRLFLRAGGVQQARSSRLSKIARPKIDPEYREEPPMNIYRLTSRHLLLGEIYANISFDKHAFS